MVFPCISVVIPLARLHLVVHPRGAIMMMILLPLAYWSSREGLAQSQGCRNNSTYPIHLDLLVIGKIYVLHYLDILNFIAGCHLSQG